MIKIIRVAVVTTIAVLWSYQWNNHRGTGNAVIDAALIGFVAGLLMGTWWALALTPGAIVFGIWLWRRLECADCPAGDEWPLFLGIVVFIGYSLIPISTAAIGTFLSKLIANRWLQTTEEQLGRRTGTPSQR